MLNKTLLASLAQDTASAFCIDFTNSTIDGSVKISTNTQNSFNYSINNTNYYQLANAGDTISVPKGSKLYMRGVNKVGNLFTSWNKQWNAWTITGNNVKLSGNIQDLLNDNDNDTITKSYAFSYLFYHNTAIISASNLILPATNLADYCYESMFDACTSLISAPKLPASTLADYCYSAMFRDCTSLTTAPELPATTLARYCYSYMFSGCTSLTSAPKLPVTSLADYCYNYMFSGCTSLTTAPELPATTLANSCYSYMFQSCSSLINAPELPATTLANECYAFMFHSCSSLINAPELPATTLTEYCYLFMFYYCRRLNYVKCLATDILADYCTNNWLSGVASTGTFVKNPAMNSWTTGTRGIPSGWTVQNA